MTPPSWLASAGDALHRAMRRCIAGWRRLETLAARRWAALPPTARTPATLGGVGLLLAALLLLAFYLTIQSSIQHAEARQRAEVVTDVVCTADEARSDTNDRASAC